MKNITLIMLLSFLLSGCAGMTHYSHVSSDIPFLADALSPIVEASDSVFCKNARYRNRTAAVGVGRFGAGSSYSAHCKL